mmetsp:Transcript_14996/g.41206  ORF Transcript_14996/g.41206 Transcript_14996/m.41206 type:complete len:201 (+) Transcript_14996:1290-1892(+)
MPEAFGAGTPDDASCNSPPVRNSWRANGGGRWSSDPHFRPAVGNSGVAPPTPPDKLMETLWRRIGFLSLRLASQGAHNSAEALGLRWRFCWVPRALRRHSSSSSLLPLRMPSEMKLLSRSVSTEECRRCDLRTGKSPSKVRTSSDMARLTARLSCCFTEYADDLRCGRCRSGGASPSNAAAKEKLRRWGASLFSASVEER